MSHEINNPLTIVLGGLSLVGKRLPPGTEDAQWIERAREGAQQIQEIVGRMNNITQVAEFEHEGLLPPMLDIKKSGEAR